MFPRLHGPEAGCFQPTPVITEGHLKDSALGANINSLTEPGPCWQDVAAVPWPQAPVPAGHPLTHQALVHSRTRPWSPCNLPGGMVGDFSQLRRVAPERGSLCVFTTSRASPPRPGLLQSPAPLA